MISSIDPSADRFLADLSRIQERSERAQRQLSSGLRISTASDDPDHVQELLVARMRLEQVTQIRMNLGRVKAEVDAAENTLQTAAQMLDRAAEIGVDGANSTRTPEARKTLALQAQAILEELVAITGTNVEGRYVFSGDSDHTAPYTLDPTQPNGVSAYAGSAATRQIVHPTGARFGVAKTAQEIFDNPDPRKNAFAALNSLRVALENGPTASPGDPLYATQLSAQSDAIAAALLTVRGARDHVNAELAFYGSVQNRVDEAIEYANKLELREKTALSNLQDADITAAALELSQAGIQQDAALSARAMLPRSSLFDFLG
jgi:flagellar hook-associated protein 3 FlgL